MEPSRTSKTRARLFTILTVAAVATGFALLYFRTRPRDLIRNSQVVCTFPAAWSAPNFQLPGTVTTEAYYWLPDRTLLLLKGDGHAEHVVRADTLRGTTRPLARLDAAQRKRALGFDILDVSPDGRRLLCREGDGSDYHLFATDDSEEKVVTAHPKDKRLSAGRFGLPTSHWLDTTDQWVSYPGSGEGPAHLYSTSKGHLKTWGIPDDVGSSSEMLSGNRLISFSPIDLKLKGVLLPGSRRDWTFYIYTLGAPGSGHTFQAHLPFEASIKEFVPARSRPRIAWLLDVDPPAPASWPTRALQWLYRSKPSTQLWVSDMEGHGFQQVAVYNGRPWSGRRKSEYPTDLQWTPDGKAISFQYGHAIRQIAVE